MTLIHKVPSPKLGLSQEQKEMTTVFVYQMVLTHPKKYVRLEAHDLFILGRKKEQEIETSLAMTELSDLIMTIMIISIGWVVMMV